MTAGIRSVVVCAPDSPRALPAEVVAEAAPGWAWRCRWPERRPRRSSRPSAGAGADDGVVVCGSLYVVADALRLLRPGPS